MYRECNINTVEVATVEEFALTAFISSLKKYIAIYRFDKKESQSGFNFSPAIKHFFARRYLRPIPTELIGRKYYSKSDSTKEDEQCT